MRGNGPTAINDGGYLGKTLELSPMGNMRVSPMTRLIGSTFWGTTIDANFWTTLAAGGGATITQGAAGSSNQMIMTVTNVNPEFSGMQSLRTARYIGASANLYRAVVQLGTNTGIANNTRRWGAFNTVGTLAVNPAPANGCYFELSGTTFQVVTCRNAVAAPVTTGSFNGQWGVSWSPDLNSHTYEIYWTNSSVWFCVDDKLLHKASFGSSPWSDYSSLKITAENLNNGAVAGGSILYVRVSTISRLGPSKTRPKWWRQAADTAGLILKYGPGTLHGVTLNSAGTNPSTLSIYDDVAVVAGNLMAVINTNNANLAFQPFGIDGLDFYNGLFIVASSGASKADTTIIYE